MRTKYWINTRDKPGLLLAMMHQFENSANISFEGSLNNLLLSSIPGASMKEQGMLKRAVLAPESDFIVIPITTETIRYIWKEITDKDHLAHEGIAHVQIEKNGKIVFGAYDNFDKECVVAYDDVPIYLLDRLKEKGVIRSYDEQSEVDVDMST